MEMIEKSLQINEQSMEIIRVIGKSLKSMELIEKSMQSNEQSVQMIRIIGKSSKSLRINGND